jgi:hypothetical protein
MKEFFINGLHLFVIVIIGGFAIFGTMALMGKFDHWNSRYIQKAQLMFNRIRRYFDRNRKREEKHQQYNFKDIRHKHLAHHETHTNDNKTMK